MGEGEGRTMTPPPPPRYFRIHYRSVEPGRSLVRRLTTPFGVQCWALAGARALGWDGAQPLAYYDADGYLLGGVGW